MWWGRVLAAVGSLGLVLGAGCAGRGAATVEVLDQRTGVTVGVLENPVEFVQYEGVPFGKRANFAYLGPVEWNRMGDYTYGLWLHIAPGDGARIGDIRAPGAVSLLLDGEPWVLTPTEPPGRVGEAYREVVSWGQTAYYEMNARQLTHLAAASRLELQCRGADGSVVALRPGAGAHAVLADYVRARHLSAD